MRLKLTLQRGDHSRVDLLTTLDTATTVGALADHLALTDPESRHDPCRSFTLVRREGGRTALSPRALVSESGLRSGASVAVEETGAGGGVSGLESEAAVIRVLSGPDEGKSFSVPSGTSVIGRERGCEVRLSDPLASRQHAKLLVTNVVEIVDLGSANGLLVGDDQADRAILRAGDRVQIGDTVLTASVAASAGERAVEPGTISFNRPPRVTPVYEGVELTSPEPPDLPRTSRFPILPLFAPLILGVVIYISTRALASLLFVAMSPLLIVANAAESRLAGRKSYREAVELFRADIVDLVTEATQAREQEGHRRRAEHPSPPHCREGALGLTPLLWSRSPDLPGFLDLRLGLGRQASRNRIVLPSGRQNNRALWRELKDAVAPFATVDAVPVVAKLTEHGAVGVGGSGELAAGVVRSLILQVTALHSPAEVVVAICASTESSALWEWVKWLPHCASPHSPMEVAPLASTLGACDGLLADLERLADGRNEPLPGPGAAPGPAVFLLIEDGAPLDRSRAVALAERGAAAGIHILWTASDTTRLPAICRTFVDLSAAPPGAAAGFVRVGELIIPLNLEPVSEPEAAAMARSLSPVVDAAAGDDEQTDLPRTVSWLALAGRELSGSSDAVLERWTESCSIFSGPYARSAAIRRPGTLRALVGQSVAGPHVLDLRSQGPHALVGGTTGSGKSELLQSWILGMASAHSPQRVTFLFVDYKGGAAFSDCLQLPHTVGLVTDLSPHLVRRALVSLSAELRYREGVLHRKGAKDLVELERSGDPEAPPSLVIVVDEFAALVQEVPEFVDGVVNVAQRGRSLGLHLILATQRPAGVIKDNLRANTNLRLALRVADDADSVDVLGSPQAAAFDPDLPGRAVSRTGPSHLIPFQAAYVGGWTEAGPTVPDIEVEVFGFGPSQAWEAPQGAHPSIDDLGPTDIQRVVRTITGANALAELDAPRKPWLAELAPTYDLARLPTVRRDDTLVFGVADDPDNQSQPTVAFHPDRDGNLAVFGTGNAGKSALLRTLAITAGLTIRGGPCHVYGLDFGAGGLRMLEELPHVGSVIAGSDHERLSRLLGMLRSLIEERAIRFAQSDAGTITDYRRLSANPNEPRILLLIDGMGAFRAAYEGTEHNRWFEAFLRIAADGRPVGVHVLLSADRPGALPSALVSLVQRRVVLRMADANDYALLGLPMDVLSTKSPPGRGLLDDTEVQVAVLGRSPDVLRQAKAVRLMATSMRQAGVADAPPIERLPAHIPLPQLPAVITDKPVFAVSAETLGPVTFDPEGTFVVAGPPASGRTTALLVLAEALCRWRPDSRLFYVGNRRSALARRSMWERCALDPTEAAAFASEVADLVGESHPGSPPCAVFIEGLIDFAGGAADFPMQEMIKRMVAAGHLVVAEGETNSLNGSYPLLVAARSGRNGIVLQPDQIDGNLLRSQFPRLRKADFPAGRGLFVSRGSQPGVVQMAMPDASPAP